MNFASEKVEELFLSDISLVNEKCVLKHQRHHHPFTISILQQIAPETFEGEYSPLGNSPNRGRSNVELGDFLLVCIFDWKFICRFARLSHPWLAQRASSEAWPVRPVAQPSRPGAQPPRPEG